MRLSSRDSKADRCSSGNEMALGVYTAAWCRGVCEGSSGSAVMPTAKHACSVSSSEQCKGGQSTHDSRRLSTIQRLCSMMVLSLVTLSSEMSGLPKLEK